MACIEIGGIYHDSKAGVREVIGMDGAKGCGDTRVAYRILAAKAEQQYDYAQKVMVPLIGTASKCDLSSFAAWAKSAIRISDKAALLATLAAKKLRLPAGEAAFMISVAKEFSDKSQIKAGTAASFGINEARAARGIEKKGLATINKATPKADGEITLTELGAAWLRAQQ